MPRIINGEITIIQGSSPTAGNGRLELDKFDLGYSAESNATTLSIKIPKKLFGYNILYEANIYPTDERYRSEAQSVPKSTDADYATLNFDIPYYVVRNSGKVGLVFLGLNGMIVVLKTLEVITYVGTSVNTGDYPGDVITQLMNSKADNIKYTGGSIQLIANGEPIGNIVDIRPVFNTYDEIVKYTLTDECRIGEMVSLNNKGCYEVYQILGRGNLTKLEFQVNISYGDLSNKPTLGGITLEGDMTVDELGLATKDDIRELRQEIDAIDKPISEYNNYTEFPRPGVPNKLYLDLAHDDIYRWDEESNRYIVISNNYNRIELISGGNANG